MAVKTYPANYNYGTGAAPYYAQPHTAGIDSLPRAQVFYRNGVAVQVNSASVDPALRQSLLDTARQHSGQPSKGMSAKQINKLIGDAIKDKLNEEKKKLASGQKRLNRAEVKKAVKGGKTIYADAASDCFYSLSWRADPDGDGTEGTAHAVFKKRDSGDGYDYDVDLDTFLDWASDSLGQFFNAEIR